LTTTLDNQDAASRQAGHAHRIACALTSVLLGLTQSLGLYLVSSNLAAIQGSLKATAAEASWLTTAYFATALWSTLLLVKVRFQFGLRPFASLGLAGFVAVSALHLLTDSAASAVAVRAALGIAAAPLSTLAVLYMMDALPGRLAAAGLLLGFATLQLGLPLSRVVSPDLLEIGRWHGLFLLDVALALLCLAAIHAVGLTPTPKRPAFNRGDALAFPLYAAGLALISVVLSQGRLYWWTDTGWLGACLAAAIACLGLFAVFELSRPDPLIDLRWLARPYMLRFVAAVLLFRVALSEQSVGIVGLMGVLGQGNEQMRTLFLLVTGGTLGGFVLAVAIAARRGMKLLAILAAALVAAAAWRDAGSTALTRPDDLYATQTMLALALALFFAAACLLGFGPVMEDGGRQLTTFLAAFSGSQYLGSLIGSAWIATTVADRQQWHYAALARHLAIGDPAVAARIAQLTAPWRAAIVDPSERGLQGLSLLVGQVTRESFVLAYNDVFVDIACLGAAMALWLAWLAWRPRRRALPGTAAA